MVELLGNYEIPILDAKVKSRVAYAQTGVSGMGVMEWTDHKAIEESEALAMEVMVKVKQLQLK